MTTVVTDNCRGCRFTDCVSVCPVEAFHVDDEMLYINPDVCIDCSACVPECPVEAIHPDTDDGADKYLEVNRKFADTWPNITRKGDSPGDADDWRDKQNKFEEHFSENPGQGT